MLFLSMGIHAERTWSLHRFGMLLQGMYLIGYMPSVLSHLALCLNLFRRKEREAGRERERETTQSSHPGISFPKYLEWPGGT